MVNLTFFDLKDTHLEIRLEKNITNSMECLRHKPLSPSEAMIFSPSYHVRA
jgi:hypothetical protein